MLWSIWMPSLALILIRTTPFSAKYILGQTCGEQEGKCQRGERGEAQGSLSSQVLWVLPSLCPEPWPHKWERRRNAHPKQTQPIFNQDLVKADCTRGAEWCKVISSSEHRFPQKPFSGLSYLTYSCVDEQPDTKMGCLLSA